MTPTSPKSIAMQGIQGFTGSKSFKDAASFCRVCDFFGAYIEKPPEKMVRSPSGDWYPGRGDRHIN